MRHFLGLSFAVLLLAGCSTLGGGTERSCLSRTAALEIEITDGYNAAVDLLLAKVINVATADKALNGLDAANALVNKATILCQVDEPSATDYLTQAGALVVDSIRIIGG